METDGEIEMIEKEREEIGTVMERWRQGETVMERMVERDGEIVMERQ